MINKATILGYVGKKDFKTTKTGTQLCQLSVATNKKYIDSQGYKKNITTWHNINFFGRIAEVANKYALVGELVYIEGEINNKKIDENGIIKMMHSITGCDIKVLNIKNKENKLLNENDNIGNMINEDLINE